jgi:glycosyltransferase involved in cell wall biosynthesis
MTKLNNPKVSIAICTFNGEKFIAEQLESVLKQSYQNIEIIIVDDCSSDETSKICESYHDERIKLFKNKENIGYTKNFERAISICNGDYICLCDQDDIWFENKIEILVQNFADHILVYHDSNFIDELGRKIETSTMGQRYHMYEGNSALPFLLSNCISGHAAMFDRSILPYLLPFDKRFFHDWWLAYVAVNLGEIKYINQVLVSYRQHTSSITDNLGLKNDLIRKPVRKIRIDNDWLKKCSDFTFNRDQEVIETAKRLFINIQQGTNRVELFFFLIKYYDLIFYISSKKKSLLSKINFARKICFSRIAPFQDISKK